MGTGAKESQTLDGKLSWNILETSWSNRLNYMKRNQTLC